MKVLHFNPSPLSEALEKHSPRQRATEAGGQDFASILKQASDTAAPPAKGPTGAVGRENSRALTLPPLSELGMAGQLLNRLSADIRAASPETLRNVHNLEGLIYVYHKAGG